MVESAMRFLIEQVVEVENAYSPNTELAPNFLARRNLGQVHRKCTHWDLPLASCTGDIPL
jgi:hypothetical protein